MELTASLLRIAKDYNINHFGKRGIRARILVLLRRDIAQILKGRFADTAKLFSSYAAELKWYEHEQFKIDENRVRLKKLINRRISINMKEHTLDFDKTDPWSSLVQHNHNYYGSKSSFKFILDHTFYRPRDLLLLFNPIDALEYPIPIIPQNIETLIIKYSNKFADELKNELSLFYRPKEISSIMGAIKNIADYRYTFTYEQFAGKLQTWNVRDPYSVIKNLFEYSAIGNYHSNGHLEFKHRETEGQEYEFNDKSEFVFHNAIKVFSTRKVISES